MFSNSLRLPPDGLGLAELFLLSLFLSYSSLHGSFRGAFGLCIYLNSEVVVAQERIAAIIRNILSPRLARYCGPEDTMVSDCVQLRAEWD